MAIEATDILDDPGLMDSLIELIWNVNAEIMDVYQASVTSVEQKADGSPVTIADLAAHRCFMQGLTQLTLMFLW